MGFGLADPLFKTKAMNEITIEDDALHFFDKHKQTFRGINAGDYIDKEDFEKFAASLNRQGCRWDKNMDVRLKAWIERLLKESGILKHGLHPSVHESHNTFLVSIEETFHQEREKWLSESIEPCATSSENEKLYLAFAEWAKDSDLFYDFKTQIYKPNL